MQGQTRVSISARRGFARFWRFGATVALGLFVLLQPAAAQDRSEAGDIIRLGAVISETGVRGSLGAHMARGYALAAQQINALGGVEIGNRAYEIKIVFRDDRSDPATAAAMAEELIREEGIDFLLGSFSTSVVAAMVDVAEAYEVPMVQAGGSALSLYENDPRYHFGIVATSDQYLEPAIRMAADQVLRRGGTPAHLRIAAVLRDDVFGHEARQGIVEEVERWGMSLVYDEMLTGTLTDLSGTLRAVADAGADVLLLSAYAQGAELTVRQLAEQRIDLPLVVLSHCDGTGIEAGGSNADYVVCTSQWTQSLTYRDRWFGSSADFLVEYHLAYDYEPPYQAAQAAAAVLTFADAFERAGSLERLAVREALARSDLTTFFGPVRFDVNGRNIAKPMVMLQIQGGRYVVVWPDDIASARLIYPAPTWETR